MLGWNADTQARSAGVGAVTIVEGAAFCVSYSNGDIDAERPHGMFFRDTRVVSEWVLTVNGMAVETLSAMTPQPYRSLFVCRAGHIPGRADTPLVVERDRRIATGIREDITLRNYSPTAFEGEVELAIAADFADIFDVKDGRPHSKWERTSRVGNDRLVLSGTWEGDERGVTVFAPGAEIEHGHLSYRVLVPSHGSWTRTIQVTPATEAEDLSGGFPLDRPLHESEPERRLAAWHSVVPVRTIEDESIQQVLERSQTDLGSLRIFDAQHPDRAVVAAGAPWFMALFGRDSLFTSYMALPLDPSLAFGTLQTLADLQGENVVPVTEEQPGRILHEVRLGPSAGLALGGERAYFGSVDATPLFVVVLGELSRWGMSSDAVHSLLPHADRALEWIDNYGDRDGDGFVEYVRMSDHGLLNQGWKDSWDGINFADGTLAEAPIALCEVQGYVYSAFLARALLAKEAGRPDEVQHWVERAVALKAAFNARFWLPDRGYFAIALDRDKQPVDASASNIGHCLWSGIVDDEKAPLVAERLMSPEMFSGWGVRTLGTDMGAYNPASYHNGAVWPHDNAVIVAGLMRYGFVEQAQRLALAVFDAAVHFDGRLPELFCGFDRERYPEPVPYPSSCSPQAWAAASPFLLMRALMRFDPCVPTSDVWIAPVLPDSFGRFHVANLSLAGSRLTVDVSSDNVVVDGLRGDLRLHRWPRPGNADLVDLLG